jgi:L-asparaginase
MAEVCGEPLRVGRSLTGGGKRMMIKFFSTGGTIDKIYFDRKSTYQVGESRIEEILKEANVGFDYEVESIMRKDSLDLSDEDRRLIFDRVSSDPHEYIIVTHGTDTMDQTARTLKGIKNKVIVLTGAMQPAKFISSDAEFNIGFAVAALQTLPYGVYLAMNGRIFHPGKNRKNVDLNRFEAT